MGGDRMRDGLTLCVAVVAGLRSMGRASFPVGLCLVTGKTPDKGYPSLCESGRVGSTGVSLLGDPHPAKPGSLFSRLQPKASSHMSLK